MSGRARQRGGPTIIIRRETVEEHAHGSGAWKIAYADFVTAMMAFFLLMWLLNGTTEEQRRGIADFFAPGAPMSRSVNGSGEPLGGRTPNDTANVVSTSGAVDIQPGPIPILMDVEEDDSETPALPLPWRQGPEGPEDVERARLVQAAPPNAPPGRELGRIDPVAGPGSEAPAEPAMRAAMVALLGPDAAAMTAAEQRREAARREAAAFDAAATAIRDAIRNDPGLAELGSQLLIEQVPEGMRIQLLDADRQPMFPLGGSAPNERARALLVRVVQALAALPNALAVAGHTDATPFRGGQERSNWDLSAERANATRRILVDAGIAEARIASVTGHAEREPLLRDQPAAPANRRVAITLLRRFNEPVAPRPRPEDRTSR